MPQRLQGRLGMPAEAPTPQGSQWGGSGGATPQQVPLQQRAHWGGPEAGTRQRGGQQPPLQQRPDQQRPPAKAPGSGWDSPEALMPQRVPQGRPAAQAPARQGSTWEAPPGPVSQVAQQGRQVAEAPLPRRLQGRLGGAHAPPQQAPQWERAPAEASAQHGASWEESEPMHQDRGQSTSGSQPGGNNEAQVQRLRPEQRSLTLCGALTQGMAAWQREAASVFSFPAVGLHLRGAHRLPAAGPSQGRLKSCLWRLWQKLTQAGKQ